MIGAPELAVDVGFALSVSATAALVVIAPVWSRRLVGRGWPKPLADAVSVAAAAQLVTAPLVAGISGTFSLVSVAANLAVAAVIPPITVVGTAAAARVAFWPPAAQLLIRFTGPELWWLLRVARGRRRARRVVPVPSGAAGVCAWRLRGSAQSCCGGGDGAASRRGAAWSTCSAWAITWSAASARDPARRRDVTRFQREPTAPGAR